MKESSVFPSESFLPCTFIMEYHAVMKILHKIPAIDVLIMTELGSHSLVTLELMVSRQ